MKFVDTNYFLRFILDDNLIQNKKATDLFQSAARGKEKLFTSLIVFFEIYWVLSSFYGKRKLEVFQTLRDILKMSFIRFENRKILEQAVDMAGKINYDLEDSYNLVWAKNHKAKDFLTFDKKNYENF